MHLAFYKHRGRLTDRVIRLASGGPYSHVEIVNDWRGFGADSLSIAASKRDGKRVREKWITFKPGHWDVIEADGDYGLALDALEMPYDQIGAALSVTRWGREKPSAWFCSELAAACVGMVAPWRYDPNELAKELGLEA